MDMMEDLKNKITGTKMFKAGVILILIAVILVNVDTASSEINTPVAKNTGVGMYDENDGLNLLNPFSLLHSIKDLLSSNDIESMKFIISDGKIIEKEVEKSVQKSDLKLVILGSGVDVEKVSYAYGRDFVDDDLTPEGEGSEVASEVKEEGAELVIAKADGSDEEMVLKALDWSIRQRPDVIYIEFDFECGSNVDEMITKAKYSGIEVLSSCCNLEDLSELLEEAEL